MTTTTPPTSQHSTFHLVKTKHFTKEAKHYHSSSETKTPGYGETASLTGTTQLQQRQQSQEKKSESPCRSPARASNPPCRSRQSQQRLTYLSRRAGLSCGYDLEALQKLRIKKHSLNAKWGYYSQILEKFTAVCIWFSVFVGFMLFQHLNSF